VILEETHRMGNPLYYAAAATTAIAGLLHLILDLTHFGSNILGDTFFIVAGIHKFSGLYL
jgi:hypothetical protein